jgi:hypothetical protein
MPSTVLAEPLPWSEGSPRPRRRWLVAGGAGLAAAGAIVAVIAVIATAAIGSSGGDDVKPPEPQERSTIATPEPAHAPEPAPVPAPVPDPEPAADSTPPPPDGEPASAAKPPRLRQSPTPAVASRKSGPASPSPARPEVAAPAEPEVSRMWNQVREAIKALRQSPRTRADGELLFTRWRRIQIQTAMLNEESRRDAMAELAELQRLIAAARSKQP